MLKCRVLGILLATLSLASHASFRDGHKLHSWAEADDRIAAGTATEAKDFQEAARLSGYVTGVYDFSQRLYCGSENVNIGQILDIVKKYLVEHPDLWEERGSRIVTVALATAFPCPKK